MLGCWGCGVNKCDNCRWVFHKFVLNDVRATFPDIATIKIMRCIVVFGKKSFLFLLTVSILVFKILIAICEKFSPSIECICNWSLL